ncbi:MAG TPA: cupredoxin domain-containing protein [Candidatus Eisenbacteria bacterium]|nr:cupredoxin domain-containing protein [Candidatus Eisenbacteria bacterium]
MHRWIFALSLAALAASGCGSSQPARTAAQPSPAGPIAITVTEEGFEPAEVRVAEGAPVTLVVTRKTEKTCATEFVMKSEGINQPLPLNQPVTIAFTPKKKGSFRYACGMDMIAGKVIVE